MFPPAMTVRGTPGGGPSAKTSCVWTITPVSAVIGGCKEVHTMDAYRSPWLDDELDMYREAVRRFVENEIVPHDARWREQHHVDREIWNKAGGVGLLCTDIPAEYGGVGGDVRHEAVVAEEMGRHGITSLGHTVHSIVAHYVLNYGTEAQ